MTDQVQTVPPLDTEAAWNALQVPQGTREKLTRYEALLKSWSEKFNLVAASTLPHIWTRHFLDSAQLWPLLPPKTRILVDMGSGAGFPGLVLSIMGVPEVHLIESTGKKVTFLRTVVDELGLNVTVHQARAEKIRDVEADVVTARALSSMPELLSLAKPFMGKESVALFLKGSKADAELTEAAKYWTFDCCKTPSLSDPTGVVLAVRNLKVLRPHDSRRQHR